MKKKLLLILFVLAAFLVTASISIQDSKADFCDIPNPDFPLPEICES